jgi:hypothetical protein
MYRNLENLAKAMSASFREQDKQFPATFEKVNFPVRLNSIAEAHKLCNWNSFGTFEKYMRFSNGLSNDDIDLLLEDLKSFVEFQKTFFPQDKIYLPIEQFYKSLMLFKIAEVLGVKGDVFEIGPGVGTNALIFGKHTTSYHATEVTESFYIFQSMLYSFVYKNKFDDAIWHGIKDYNCCYNTKEQQDDIFPEVLVDNTRKTVFQYPYWKMNELYNNNKYEFELVMSNANLLEMTTEALDTYMDFISKKLANNGFFMYFGCGADFFGDNVYLIKKICSYGLKPIAIFHGYCSPIFDSCEIFIDEPIVISAYGDELKNMLLAGDFSKYAKKVYILDDNKTGFLFDKYEFITREKAKELNIKKGIIVHVDLKIIKIFEKIFDELGIENISPIYIPSNIGIFTKNEDMIDRYKIDFQFSYIDKNYKNILDLFKKNENKMNYSEDEILENFRKKYT